MKPIDEELLGITHRAQAINSKRKGNKNELRLAKMISAWTGSEFTRVPQSGGLRWSNTQNICGDIISTSPTFVFPFVIETKHYKDIPLKGSLRANSIVYKFWKQVCRDAERANRLPMLILRANYWKDYVIFLDENIVVPLKPDYYGYSITGYHSSEFLTNVEYGRFVDDNFKSS
jgi:hypothetical protein